MSGIIFNHRNIKNFRVTLAGKVEGDNLKVSISICTPSDNFKKSQGRRISEGRLNKGVKSVSIPLEGNNPSYALNTYSKGLSERDIKSVKEEFGIKLHSDNK